MNSRNLRKERIGIVTSNKMQKSIVVSEVKRVKHPMYGKFVLKTKKYVAHDDKDDCNIGDTVIIMETKPISASKCWRLVEIIEKANFNLVNRPIGISEKAMESLSENSIAMLYKLTPKLQDVSWTREELEMLGKSVAETFQTSFGKLAASLRAALAGQVVTPSVFDMMLILGRDETIARLEDVTKKGKSRL